MATHYSIMAGKNSCWLTDETQPRSSIRVRSWQAGQRRGGTATMFQFFNELANILGPGTPTIHDISKAELEQTLTANAGALGYVA